MDRKEAIEILDDNRIFTHACEYTEEEQWEALEKAKESMEAWEKIIKRIELERLGYAPSAGYYRGIMKALEIIKSNIGG